MVGIVVLIRRKWTIIPYSIINLRLSLIKKIRGSFFFEVDIHLINMCFLINSIGYLVKGIIDNNLF